MLNIIFTLIILFSNFFKNLFADPAISDARLRKFCEDHLARLANENGGGLYTTVLNDTAALYTAYFGNIQNADVATAVRQSLTSSNDNVMATFKKEASKLEGVVISVYDNKQAPEYQEFYPAGLTEYSNATKENVEVLMNRINAALSNHSADFPPATITLFNSIKSNWTTSRNLQLDKKSEVSSLTTGKNTTRVALETQLTKNMHFVGFTFPGNVDRCDDFFDEAMLRTPVNPNNDGLGRGTGVLVDAQGNKIKNVTVHVVDAGINDVTTGDDGVFLTPNMAVGTKIFRFSGSTIEPLEKEFEILDEGVTDLGEIEVTVV